MIFQLEEYLKERDKIEDDTYFKFKDWLDVISLGVNEPDAKLKNGIKLYKVPELKNPDVYKAVKFVRSKFWNNLDIYNSVFKETMDESIEAEKEQYYQRLESKIEKMKKGKAKLKQGMLEAGLSEEKVKELLNLLKGESEEMMEDK